MGSKKSGYEYRYRVSVGDEFREKEGKQSPPWRTYILWVRTNFILKPIGAEEILMDTEIFGDRMTVDDEDIPNFGPKSFLLFSGKKKLDSHIRDRLSLYCMPDADIRALAQMAFDTVHDPRYDPFYTIPVLASVDVYTVQLEGEPLDATIDRSVKPDFLIPLKLRWSWSNPINRLHSYLLRLPVVRVREEVAAGDDVIVVREDVDIDMDSCSICLQNSGSVFVPDMYAFHEKHSVSIKDGLGLMEMCRFCLGEPVAGAKIASLPCKHAFHDHCIFRWLLKSQWCPVCRVEINFN